MKILGIDPSLTSSGWGLIEVDNDIVTLVDYGFIKTIPKNEIQFRLATIFTTINNIINQHKPQQVCIEKGFINSNFGSSLSLGMVAGTMFTAVGLANIPLLEFSPTAIKKAITGQGKADKEDVKTMLKFGIVGLGEDLSLDSSDALACAYCGYLYIRSAFNGK